MNSIQRKFNVQFRPLNPIKKPQRLKINALRFCAGGPPGFPWNRDKLLVQMGGLIKKRMPFKMTSFARGPTWTRTRDQLIMSQLL